MGDFLYICYMNNKRVPYGFWTKEECIKAGNTCSTRTEFRNKYDRAYRLSLKNGWDEAFRTIRRIGNRKLRCNYRYIFSDGCAYTGLTENMDNRHKSHMKEGPVYQHMVKTNLIPELVLLNDYIISEDAVKVEKKDWDSLTQQGYRMLNTKKPCGELGGNYYIWDYQTCKEAASKCKHRTEFHNKYSSAYDLSNQEGWLDEFFKHREEIRKPNGYWNDKEKCRVESIKYKVRNEFSKKCSKAYYYSRINGWLDEFFPKSI
jgi:predicted GIY-YIG superfamily endonuclease